LWDRHLINILIPKEGKRKEGRRERSPASLKPSRTNSIKSSVLRTNAVWLDAPPYRPTEAVIPHFGPTGTAVSPPRLCWPIETEMMSLPFQTGGSNDPEIDLSHSFLKHKACSWLSSFIVQSCRI